MEKLFEKIEAGQWELLCNRQESGLPHIQYLYNGYWQGEDGEIDLKKVRQEVPKLQDRLANDLLCIDVEGEIWTPRITSWGSKPADWQIGSDRLIELIELLRELLPDVHLSCFGAAPSIVARHLNGYHAGQQPDAESPGRTWRDYLNARRLMIYQRKLAEHLDFYTPVLYWDYWHWRWAQSRDWWPQAQFTDEWGKASPTYQRQTSPMQVWLDVARHGIQMCRDLLPAKPIIPSTTIQWWTPAEGGPDYMPARGELVYPSWVRRMLAELRKIADSAFIWLDVEQAGLEHQKFFGSKMWAAMIETNKG